jgi:glycosyltransferase involved in cell wall biosynthesis
LQTSKRPPRVGINAQLLAFTADYRQAGLSRYIYELLTNLPHEAPDLALTAFVGNAPVPPEFARQMSANLTLVRSRLPTMKPPVRIAWEQLALPVASARAKLNLLHCPVNVRPLSSPCPVIITIHDLIFLRYPQNFHPLKRLYLAAMTGWSARQSAHIITVSETTRRDVIEMLQVPPQRVTTVHNGVGTQFKPLPEAARAQFMLEKSLSRRTLLYLGTLEPRKNVTTLLRAFKPLADEPEFADVSLLIGGSKGWYYDEVFATAQQLGLLRDSRVKFLGRVPDEELPLWYNVATVFTFPSVYEGFGLPPLEAMACGAPAITSNTSSLPEVVGDAGVLVAPDDTNAWTSAMRMLLSDEARRAELSEKAIERASAFSWQQTARETATVYRRVLSDDGVQRTKAGGETTSSWAKPNSDRPPTTDY